MSTQRRFGRITSELQRAYEDKQVKESSSSFSTVTLPDGFSFFRFPKDRNFVKIDILPFIAHTENGEQPLTRYNYYIHRNVGSDGASVICPQKQKGLRCPICDYLHGLSWNDPADKELRRKYREQKRQLYAIRWIDGPPDVRDRVLVFDTSEYGFGRILDDKIDKRDVSDPSEAAWDLYADLEEGFTLKLNLSEQSYGGSQMYTAVTSVEFKPRTQQYTEDWFDKTPDLTQCINMLDYDAINERFSGGSSSGGSVVSEDVVDASGASNTSTFDIGGGYNPIVKPNPPQPDAGDGGSVENASEGYEGDLPF